MGLNGSKGQPGGETDIKRAKSTEAAQSLGESDATEKSFIDHPRPLMRLERRIPGGVFRCSLNRGIRLAHVSVLTRARKEEEEEEEAVSGPNNRKCADGE